jgi:predicted methyltransferase
MSMQSSCAGATASLLLLLATAAMGSGCSGTPSAATPEAADTRAIAAALASTGRLPGDAEQDQRRQAEAVLVFLGVAPGQRVIDVFAAGGYYTELLSRVVGPDGRVLAYNNPPYARFAEKGIAARYADGRLANVDQLTSDIDALGLQPASWDAAIFVMSYHDLYWRPKDGSWPATDPNVMVAALHAALRPGGVVVVQDHVAIAGSDPYATVDKLHRIDPAVVRRDFERAGFVFDGTSKVLAHPDDDHTKLVFDPSIQGKTDQFVHRYRKPTK